MTTTDDKMQTLKAVAVRQALVEVLSENKPEIIKRAKAKLVAMGVAVDDDELEQQL